MTPIDRSIVASVTVLAFEFFAGIMIWSTALGACGVPSVSVFSEIDPDAILVSTCHHPAALSLGDIEELTLQDVLAVVEQYPNALVTMVGGPPCTDVSLLKHDRQGAFGVCSRLRENFRQLVQPAREALGNRFVGLMECTVMDTQDRLTRFLAYVRSHTHTHI